MVLHCIKVKNYEGTYLISLTMEMQMVQRFFQVWSHGNQKNMRIAVAWRYHGGITSLLNQPHINYQHKQAKNNQNKSCNSSKPNKNRNANRLVIFVDHFTYFRVIVFFIWFYILCVSAYIRVQIELHSSTIYLPE